MTTNYPGAIDGAPAVHADVSDAVHAIQLELGVNPSGDSPDVATVLGGLSATYGAGSDLWLKLLAQEFGFVFTGGLTVDATTGLPTAGAVKWPDAKSGTFAGTVDTNYYTGFTVTWVNGGTTKTVTVTGITYDTTNGLPLGPTGLAVA